VSVILVRLKQKCKVCVHKLQKRELSSSGLLRSE